MDLNLRLPGPEMQGLRIQMLCLVSLGGRTTILLSPKLYLELYQPKTVSKGCVFGKASIFVDLPKNRSEWRADEEKILPAPPSCSRTGNLGTGTGYGVRDLGHNLFHLFLFVDLPPYCHLTCAAHAWH